jgi:hypothetical protein
MIRADVHKPFFRKFLFVFLGCVGFGLWCLYDGLVAYPQQLTMAEAYEALPEDDRLDAWKTLAAENGWPTRTPSKSAEEIKHDIGSQFMMVVLCGICGIPALMMWLSGQGTYVEGDETLIRNSRGKEVPIDSIQSIDKRKWERKGIAKIRYDVDGKTKTFVMDDFKYQREPMGKLMRIAEANLSPEQIDGDLLEREKDAQAAAEDDAAEDDAADVEAEREAARAEQQPSS